MPIYEYTCNACDKRFEQLVRSMTSEEKVKCPECGSTRTARALSVFAVGSEGPKRSASLPRGGGCGRCSEPGGCAMD